MGGPYPEAWRLIKKALPDDRRNVEEVLSSVRQKLATILEADTSAGLDGEQLGKLEDAIKRTIAREVRPDAARFPDQLPHEALGRWLRNVERETPVEIFTLNYDTQIERGLERERVPIFDGFIGAYWGMNVPVGGKEQPLLIVLDEAHRFLREGVDTAATRACSRIAKEGRKYGAGLMIVTQRPPTSTPAC
jgi:hypothetical protein